MRGWGWGLIGAAWLVGQGCAVNLARRSPWDVQQLVELSDQLEQFKTLAQLKAEEADQLREAKTLLEQRLNTAEASIGYDERGLVTRLLDAVLFDSGKAELKPRATQVLDKVGRVLQQIPDQPVGIEGHTDNEPIQRSGWSDNNALSIARANAVAEYLIEHHEIDRSRLTTVGYGEERPIASNDTIKGRQKNRRVEVVILPKASGTSYKAHAAARASRRSRPYKK